MISKLFLAMLLLIPVTHISNAGMRYAGNVQKISPVKPAKPLEVPIVSEDIIVDGYPSEAAWDKIPFSIYKRGKTSFFAKALSDGKKLYLLIRFSDKAENRKHCHWHWDPILQIYVSGEEQEDTLTLAWRSGDSSLTDIWVWRSERTDSAGYADDYFFIRHGLIRSDAGKSCWFSLYFGEFAGDTVQRFYQRSPSGSLGDVAAKGVWQSGWWNVEFSRALKTGNSDDLEFVKGKTYSLEIFTGFAGDSFQQEELSLKLLLPENLKTGTK
jgi:hypothetical protein